MNKSMLIQNIIFVNRRQKYPTRVVITLPSSKSSSKPSSKRFFLWDNIIRKTICDCYYNYYCIGKCNRSYSTDPSHENSNTNKKNSNNDNGNENSNDNKISIMNNDENTNTNSDELFFPSPSSLSCWDKMSNATRKLAEQIMMRSIVSTVTGSKDENDHERFQDDKRQNLQQRQRRQRVALSRAITLMESKNEQKRQQGDYLLTFLLENSHDAIVKKTKDSNDSQTEELKEHLQQQQNGQVRKRQYNHTLRIGFAGPPGVGKSTMVESFGKYILEQTKDYPTMVQLAVLCIDPSSNISGGSILGDKTRMVNLSKHERAYVRPSSNGGIMGGLAAYTDDVISLLSVAGGFGSSGEMPVEGSMKSIDGKEYDGGDHCDGENSIGGYPLIFVETVGLGQSETEIAQSVDVLILLIPPSGGDELQGIKKGIVELANIIVITKADGTLLSTARSTAGDYRNAIKFLQSQQQTQYHHHHHHHQHQRHHQRRQKNDNDNNDIGSNERGEEEEQEEEQHVWDTPVVLTSSVTEDGFDTLWNAIQEYEEYLLSTNTFELKRQSQSQYWFRKHFLRMVQGHVEQDPTLQKAAEQIKDDLSCGRLTPRVAAKKLANEVFETSDSELKKIK